MMKADDSKAGLDRASCAVLMGVDDYRIYDSSGANDLLGSRNDVRAWVGFCRQRLGIPPERILLLTSPLLTPELLGSVGIDIPKENFRGGDGASIREGVRWLGQRIAEGSEHPLLTWSGHGSLDATEADSAGVDVALCPSDIRKDKAGAVTGLLPFGEIQRILDSEILPCGRTAENLTVVLDTCFTPPPEGSFNPRYIAPPLPGLLSAPLDMRLTGRLLLAARKGQAAQEIPVGSGWQGAFSTALRSVSEQWKSVPDGAGTRLTLSHSNAMARSHWLLKGLGLAQDPWMTYPLLQGRLALFQKGSRPASTSRTPDRDRPDCQLDAGESGVRIYRFTNGSTGAVLGQVTVTTANLTGAPSGYASNTEYWRFSKNALTSIKSSSRPASISTTILVQGTWAQVSGNLDWTPGSGDSLCTWTCPTLPATWTSQSSGTSMPNQGPTYRFNAETATGVNSQGQTVVQTFSWRALQFVFSPASSYVLTGLSWSLDTPQMTGGNIERLCVQYSSLPGPYVSSLTPNAPWQRLILTLGNFQG